MYIHAKVNTGAKKESFVEKSKDHFVVSVREPAERNLANKRIIELIAEHFNLSVGKIRIINGHHSPSKILSIDLD